MFYAHSTEDESLRDWHRLRDHLRGTAKRAATYGHRIGIGRACWLAGLLHDLGKYSEAFQRRLVGMRERVDHATAGAVEVLRLDASPQDGIVTKLIAFAIAGHHTGLPDRYGDGGSLEDRLNKRLEPLAPTWRDEVQPVADGLWPSFRWSKQNAAFQLGFLGRMIFSCLVDADFRDTEDFYCAVEGRAKDRAWPPLSDVIDDLLADFDYAMDQLRQKSQDVPINVLRHEVLGHVRGKAGEAQGFFTLTVPTGGGKTLTSLGFALDHAKAHGLERIIYAIPFTSVIDQTASVFKNVLGSGLILEHHSAIDEERNEMREQRDKLRLAMEDWAAPIVVTTNVQLFESLFANRPSRCRKLHNIARSVIVLDEAQTIPLHLLRPAMEALRELVLNYGVTVVLCTATQPALDAQDLKDGLPLAGRELAPDPAKLARALKRTDIRIAGEMTDQDLVEELRNHSQGLIIVNSRKHALDLYRQARDAGLEGVLHLTTRQYAAHRREILNIVRQRLRDKQPCRLIATSLVEAGVDLDFPRVWRAEAGLDQIAQAAGRCNREGLRPLGDSVVIIFKAPDHPPPVEIRQLAADFGRIVSRHDDLFAPAAMQDYFGEVYWRKGAEGLDRAMIMAAFRLDGSEVELGYRSVAESFRMIESGLAPVIVARDPDACTALKKLNLPDVRPGSVARVVQPYIVQVPPKARSRLVANGHASFKRDDRFGEQFCVLDAESLYKDEYGLLWEDADYLELENSIF